MSCAVVLDENTGKCDYCAIQGFVFLSIEMSPLGKLQN